MTSLAPDVATTGRPTTGRPARRRTTGAVLFVVVALLIATVASMMIGQVMIGPSAVLDSGHVDHYIAEARWPRTVLALVVGAALGLAGGCMQGLTRNPLADPGILGVNAGASFAMVTAMTYTSIGSLSGRIWVALAGAAIAALVHVIAAMGSGGATPIKLVIAGAAMTAALTSWTSGVLVTHSETLETFRFWQVGTVGGRGFDVLIPAVPFFVVGAVLALLSARGLNALALGDDLAKGLGRHTGVDRVIAGTAIVLLAGTATAVAGPIAFVGLVIPHLVRMLSGSDHTKLLPLSAAYGALLLVVADTAGRIVLPPTEVQVGVMTAVVGVPVFFWFISRGRMGAL